MREKVQINLNFLPWHVTAHLPYNGTVPVCTGSGLVRYPRIKIDISEKEQSQVRLVWIKKQWPNKKNTFNCD